MILSTRRARRTVLGTVLTVGLVLATAACGDDGDDDAATASATASATESASEQAPTTPAPVTTEGSASAESPSTTAASAVDTTPTTAETSEDPAAWQAIIDAANEEGELQLNLHAGPGYEEFGAFAEEQFEALYPDIDLVWTTMRATDMTPRVLTEQQAGQYLWDIHQGPGTSVFDALLPVGAIVPMPPILEDLPMTNRRDEDWAPEFGVYSDPDNPAMFLSSIAVRKPLGINTTMVEGTFETPEDVLRLIDGSLDGKIAITDPRTTAGANGLTWFLTDQNRDMFGPDFLRELISQATITTDLAQMTQEFAEGRYAVALGVEPATLEELQAQGIGNDIEIVPFVTWGNFRSTSVYKNAPHPNALRLYLDWYFSKEAQEVWKYSSPDASSRRRDVAPPEGQVDVVDYDDPAFFGGLGGTASGKATIDEVIAIAEEVLN